MVMKGNISVRGVWSKVVDILVKRIAIEADRLHRSARNTNLSIICNTFYCQTSLPGRLHRSAA